MPKTKQEYADYEAKFAAFMEKEGLQNLSCVSGDEGVNEPFFTWRPCDCCGTRLGGNRYNADGYNPTTQKVQDGYEICEDCLMYSEYGQLDDTTMMEIEDNG